MKISEEMKDKIIFGLTAIVLILVLLLIVFSLDKEELEDSNEDVALNTTTKITTTVSEEYYVDIKGAVKKPGVYLVKKGSIVNDVIKLAGGLTSSAYTKNINLSQATYDAMVIYIFTKSEIKNATNTTTSTIKTDTTCKTEVIEINNCIETTTKKIEEDTSSKLVNINTATIEELTTLSGIGESKAKAIIAYREEQKFSSIEDLKNVSGIGDSLYDSIKDHITV